MGSRTTPFIVGVVLILYLLTFSEGRQICKEGWEPFGDSCYYFGATLETWHSAMDLCTSEGGHLARVTSRAENEYLKMRARSFPDSNYWIDVTDQGAPGTYVYGSTQAPVNFLDWNPGEPNDVNHHCVGLYHRFDFKWDDFSCSNKRRFICEIKAECSMKCL
ncbi:hypothetical protein KUTeg_011120 [Tegillarca granosa]|uniref:C-type lectin domain-containing protein n=1 Tax=Tegillarca granosa TaxID=220873 RepID=A0ABQ9F2Y1_TEGGR|nr:hypothetical protein KUTeg_011120 [Tegillarca granosa]